MLEQLLHRRGGELVDSADHGVANDFSSLSGRAVSTAQRFWQYVVDEAEFAQVVGRNRIASAASCAFSALFHRIDAQPSGEITE